MCTAGFIETEVKFKIDSITEIRQRLHSINAKSTAKVFEKTLRFDDAQKSVMRSGANLRLRKGVRTQLTFKGRPDTSKGVRSSEKISVDVSDLSTVQAILECLGYRVIQRVDKEREFWQFEDTPIRIDRMPMGLFLEIEGTKENIARTAQLLSLDFSQRILKHYGQIWEEYCKDRGIEQTDIVFDGPSSLK